MNELNKYEVENVTGAGREYDDPCDPELFFKK